MALSAWAERQIGAAAVMPRPVRRWIAFGLDSLCCVLAACLAFALRLDDWPNSMRGVVVFSVAALLCWAAIAWATNIYRNLIRYSGANAIGGVCWASACLIVPLALLFSFWPFPGIPRSLSVLQPIIFCGLLVCDRLLIRIFLIDLMSLMRSDKPSRRRVAIYGAGQAGRQLAASLRHEPYLSIVGFLDDDSRLDGQKVDGVAIWHASRLQELVCSARPSEVLLAIPSASRARRREIVDELQRWEIGVRILPGIGQLVDGEVTFSDFREVEVEDLLGRDPVVPNELLMGRALVGKVVLVSGAGGSIGSELCRQILHARPSRLILAEQSEYALYAIDAELRERLAAEKLEIDIVAELVDISDRETVERMFQRWQPDTVYHAAAYKHVPLVEANPVAGLRNNIFGTLYSALAAKAVGVERFILVSTDKAVRPTNIMGASKRICELILQAQGHGGTVFTMVRFGNVLGSSGSVVPRFREQIRAGGPITITHRDITRYFMTIPEAAQLVIQAGGMARGGEVFVLDMGQPVRIIDLARTMVRLSGLSLHEPNHPDGDIEIVEVGLRPGEKLYEELLIGDNPLPTLHPRIMQAQEAMLPWGILSARLDELAELLLAGRAADAIPLVRDLVPEYRQSVMQAHGAS